MIGLLYYPINMDADLITSINFRARPFWRNELLSETSMKSTNKIQRATDRRKATRPAMTGTTGPGSLRFPNQRRHDAEYLMPPDKSLFGRKIPCSGNRNSLFGFVREFAGKASKSLGNFACAFAEIARNSENTLIISLFSGKSPLATLELGGTKPPRGQHRQQRGAGGRGETPAHRRAAELAV